MRAQRIDGQTPGGKRTRLADVLPLASPFSVQIFPVYGCNLACAYCIHSVPTERASRCSIRTLRTWSPMRQSAGLPIRSTL